MAEKAQYEDLKRQLNAVGSVTRGLMRGMPVGLTRSSAAVLEVLHQHGDMRVGRLTRLLAVDASVASRYVTQAAARGWIERRPDPEDRRSRILRLTPAGRAQLHDLSERLTHVLADRLGDWSDEEVVRLTRLMARLHASFDGRRAGVPVSRLGREVSPADRDGKPAAAADVRVDTLEGEPGRGGAAGLGPLTATA